MYEPDVCVNTNRKFFTQRFNIIIIRFADIFQDLKL